MTARQRAKRSRVVLYLAVLAAVGFISTGLVSNLGQAGHWIPAAVVGVLGIAQLLLFERCPHCGKFAMISRNSVKHCPGCGREIDLPFEIRGSDRPEGDKSNQKEAQQDEGAQIR